MKRFWFLDNPLTFFQFQTDKLLTTSLSTTSSSHLTIVNQISCSWDTELSWNDDKWSTFANVIQIMLLHICTLALTQACFLNHQVLSSAVQCCKCCMIQYQVNTGPVLLIPIPILIPLTYKQHNLSYVIESIVSWLVKWINIFIDHCDFYFPQ